MAEDWIRIRRIRCYGHHGLYEDERGRGQIFEVDLALQLDLRPAATSDAIEDTVDYVEAYRLVERLVTGSPCLLLETLADRIARETLQRFPVNRVVVRIRKPRVVMPGPVGAVEVEIRRP